MPQLGTCEIGSLFRRCKAQGVAICQYCGRTFCANHGVFLDDHQEICLRPVCQAKRFDLEKHLVWKAQAYQRNSLALCGIEGCDQEPWGQCSRCRAVFCIMHIQDREQTVQEGQAKIVKRAAICDHCWRRLPIWSKT